MNSPLNPPVNVRGINRRGFTLIEVLATLALIAVALPAVMRAITVSGATADSARHRIEASDLAQSELAQIIASYSWENGSASGDFSPNWPQYTWQSNVTPWTGDTVGAGLDEIDLTVSWAQGAQKRSVTLTTLAYPANESTTTSSAAASSSSSTQ